MDSVRFGRAIGFGARSAARALAGAVDAATAPNPNSPAPRPRPAGATSSRPVESAQTRPTTAGPIASAARFAAHATIRTQAQAREASKGVARGSKRFGEAVWGPFLRLSGVLWLEITGSFFGIFALFAATAAWTHRADLHATPANHDARVHLLLFLAMAIVFGYFCISSFVRAHRR